MNTFLKSGCLALYLAAAIGTALPFSAASALQTAALILLGLHALELLLAFGSVKRHPGPLVDSIGLTLLFGLLHWLPLKHSAEARN